MNFFLDLLYSNTGKTKNIRIMSLNNLPFE